MQSDVETLQLALLNIAGTGRKWAVSQGGNTPLAIIARLAREALGMTVEEVDTEIAERNAAIDDRQKIEN